MVKWIVTGVTAFVLLILALVFWPFSSVPAGHVGLLSLFGKIEQKTLEPGLNFVNPMAHVIDFDIRQKSIDIQGDAGTKDLQNINTTVTVNYRPAKESAMKLYTEVGVKYPEVIVTPAVLDRLKAVTSKFNAEELITKRNEVRNQVKSAVIEAIRDRSKGDIIVDDVVVKNFGFAASFTKAVEEKQVAEQAALKAKNDLDRIKVEAEQKIATAKAEAEAFKLKSQQLTPAMIQMEAIEKWDGHLPIYQTGPTPFVDFPSYSREAKK
jgi:prohibitin 2